MKVKFELIIKLLNDLIGVVTSLAESLPDEHDVIANEIVDSEAKRLTAQAEKDNETIQKNVEERKALMAASSAEDEAKKKAEEEAKAKAEEEAKKKEEEAEAARKEEERQAKIKEASEALQGATLQLKSLKEKNDAEDDADIKEILAVKIKKAEAVLEEARKNLEELVNGQSQEQKKPEITTATADTVENKSEVEDDLHQEIEGLYKKGMSLVSIVKTIAKAKGQESVVFVIDDPIMKPIRNAIKKASNAQRFVQSTLQLSAENARDLVDYVKRSK